MARICKELGEHVDSRGNMTQSKRLEETVILTRILEQVSS